MIEKGTSIMPGLGRVVKDLQLSFNFLMDTISNNLITIKNSPGIHLYFRWAAILGRIPYLFGDVRPSPLLAHLVDWYALLP